MATQDSSSEESCLLNEMQLFYSVVRKAQAEQNVIGQKGKTASVTYSLYTCETNRCLICVFSCSITPQSYLPGKLELGSTAPKLCIENSLGKL